MKHHNRFNVAFICWYVFNGFYKLTQDLIYFWPGLYSSIFLSSSFLLLPSIFFLCTSSNISIVLHLLSRILINSFNLVIRLMSSLPILCNLLFRLSELSLSIRHALKHIYCIILPMQRISSTLTG